MPLIVNILEHDDSMNDRSEGSDLDSKLQGINGVEFTVNSFRCMEACVAGRIHLDFF